MKNDPVMTRLRASRLRPTVARVGVLQVMKTTGTTSLSAQDVFGQLLLRGTRMSCSSVYRVIHEFEACGLLLRSWTRNRKALYRLKPIDFDDQRVSLVCRDSGQRVVLPDPDLNAHLLAAVARAGLDLTSQVFEIQVERVAPAREVAAWAPRPERRGRTARQVSPSARSILEDGACPRGAYP